MPPSLLSAEGTEATVEWSTWFISDAVILRTVADLGWGWGWGRCRGEAGLELHLASREGLVLHGHCAVTAQHRDA